jgi:hypothetical protein
MKAKVAPAAINTGLARPAGTGSTNDLLYTLWGGSTGSINDAGNTYFNTPSGPAFRSVSTSESISTTLTVTMPTGVASGDVLVMQVAQYVDQKIGGFVSTPSGWTARQTSAGSGNNEFRVQVFTKTAGSSESSVVFSSLSGNYIATATILAVSGASAVDVAGAINFNVTPPNYVAASVTTTTSNGLLIGMWNRPAISGTSFTVPASMIERSNVKSSAANSIYIYTAFATETLTASGATGTRTATFSGSSYFPTATLLAVK